jgi:phage shock protein B
MSVRIPFIGIFSEAAEAMLFLATLMFLVWVLARVFRARRPGNILQSPNREEEILSRLCQQLERMERRMENLETLLDKDKEKEPERGRRE